MATIRKAFASARPARAGVAQHRGLSEVGGADPQVAEVILEDRGNQNAAPLQGVGRPVVAAQAVVCSIPEIPAAVPEDGVHEVARQSIGGGTGRHAERRQARRRTQLTVRALLRLADERRLPAQRRIGERGDALRNHGCHDTLTHQVSLGERGLVLVGLSRFHGF